MYHQGDNVLAHIYFFMWVSSSAWWSEHLDPQLICWWALLSILLMGLQLKLGCFLLGPSLTNNPFLPPSAPSLSCITSHSQFSNHFYNGLAPLLYPWVSGVAIIFIPIHSCVPTSLRIPRDPHVIRGFPWNLFQMLVYAW